MQVAEETGGASIGQDIGQHCGLRRLGESAQHFHAVAVLVEHAEILAVEVEVRGILARQHRVGLRARGDENRARRQRRLRHLVPYAVAVRVLRATP